MEDFWARSVQAVKLLVQAPELDTETGKAFQKLLTEHEAACVEFIRQVWALSDHEVKKRETMLKANGLWNDLVMRMWRAAAALEVRGRAIDRLWERARSLLSAEARVESWDRVLQCREEADHMVRSLAMGPFLHLIHQHTGESSTTYESERDKALAGLIEDTRASAPKSTEEWLALFQTYAEDRLELPCIVADVARPGLPVMWVNSRFTLTTLYDSEKAVGRNCRFLQGPATETHAVLTMQQSIAQAVRTQVLVTNYRANSDTFVNLLTMVPIHDVDGHYRYCAGFLFDLGSANFFSATQSNGSGNFLWKNARRLVRVSQILANFQTSRLPYASSRGAQKYMLRGALYPGKPISEVSSGWNALDQHGAGLCPNGVGQVASEKEDSDSDSDEEGENEEAFLRDRIEALTEDYDGPPELIKDRGNFWFTRCLWLLSGDADMITSTFLAKQPELTPEAVSDLQGTYTVLDACPAFYRTHIGAVPFLLETIGVLDVLTNEEERMISARRQRLSMSMASGKFGALFGGGFSAAANQNQPLKKTKTPNPETKERSRPDLRVYLKPFSEDALGAVVALSSHLRHERNLVRDKGDLTWRKRKPSVVALDDRKKSLDNGEFATQKLNSIVSEMGLPTTTTTTTARTSPQSVWNKRKSGESNVPVLDAWMGSSRFKVAKPTRAADDDSDDSDSDSDDSDSDDDSERGRAKGAPKKKAAWIDVDVDGVAKRMQTKNLMRDEDLKEEMDALRGVLARSLMDLVIEPTLTCPVAARELVSKIRALEVNGEDQHLETHTALKARRYADDHDSYWVAYFLPALGDMLSDKGKIGFVAADMRAPGLPLVYANTGFIRLTKYRDGVGRNCSFLQRGRDGVRSNDSLVAEMSEAVTTHAESVTKLTSYDAEGEPFLCFVVLVPIFFGGGGENGGENTEATRHSSQSGGAARLSPETVKPCAYTLGMQLGLDADFGQNLLTLDQTLRALPRTTTCVDMEARFDAGATCSHLDPSIPLNLACWLALDGPFESPVNHVDTERWTALLETVLRSPSWTATLANLSKTLPCSIVARELLRYVIQVDDIASTKAAAHKKLAAALAKRRHNVLYYFNSLEIGRGELPKTNLQKVLQKLLRWRSKLVPYLARMVLPVCLGHLVQSVGALKAEAPAFDDASLFSSPMDIARHLLQSLKYTATLSERAWASWAENADLPVALILQFADDELEIKSLNERFRRRAELLAAVPGEKNSTAQEDSTATAGMRMQRLLPDSVAQAVLADADGPRNAGSFLCVSATGACCAKNRKHAAPEVWLTQPLGEFPGYTAVAVCGADPSRLHADLALATRLLAHWGRKPPEIDRRLSRVPVETPPSKRSSVATTASSNKQTSPRTSRGSVASAATAPPAFRSAASDSAYDAETRRMLDSFFSTPATTSSKIVASPSAPKVPRRRRRSDVRLARLINKLECALGQPSGCNDVGPLDRAASPPENVPTTSIVQTTPPVLTEKKEPAAESLPILIDETFSDDGATSCHPSPVEVAHKAVVSVPSAPPL